MVYLLSTAVGLLVVVAVGTAGLLYLATRDAAAIEDGDDDDDIDIPAELVDALLSTETYIDLRPPFAIVCLGRSGEHDGYPIGPGLRQSFVDYLEASWSLPCPGRCPVCWSPVDGNQCHLHESDVQ